MSVINKYIKNASWYVFGSAVQGLTPFILTPFLTRALSKVQFSEFVLVISIGTILSFLFALGLPAAITRELILDKIKFNENFITINFVKRYLLLLSLILIFISSFLTDPYKIFGFSFALGLSLAAISLDMAIFRVKQLAYKFIYFAIFSTAIPTMLMTLGIYFGLLLNTFILFYVLFVTMFAAIQNLELFKEESNANQFTTLFKLGWPTIPHGLGMSFLQYGDRILVASIFGLTTAGVIQVAALIGTAPILLLSTLSNAWITPVLEKFNQHKLFGQSYLNKTTNYLALFILVFSILIMIGSQPLLNLFAPENYEIETMSLLVIMLSSNSLLFVIYLRNTYILLLSGKLQSLALITPLSIILQVCLLYLTSNYFGINSVAIAYSAAILIQALTTQIVVKYVARDIKLTFSPVLIWILLILMAFILIYFELGIPQLP